MTAKSLTLTEYDAIAESYENIVETIPIRLIYQHNLMLRLGDVRGLDVLDLACGPGVYTREFRQMGARRVVGIDISSEQIRLARERDSRENLGIEYLVGDVAEVGKLGEFDVVSAAMLLHYSPTEEFLAKACRSIAC